MNSNTAPFNIIVELARIQKLRAQNREILAKHKKKLSALGNYVAALQQEDDLNHAFFTIMEYFNAQEDHVGKQDALTKFLTTVKSLMDYIHGDLVVKKEALAACDEKPEGQGEQSVSVGAGWSGY